jgi:hypothetical protein
VSLQRGICSCVEQQVFSCYKGRKGSYKATRAISISIETRAVIKIFFLQEKAPKKIHAILIGLLRENVPLYCTVKNWVAQFKGDDFSACIASRPGRLKTVTTPEFIDQIHDLFLEDRQILAKSKDENLDISRE